MATQERHPEEGVYSPVDRLATGFALLDAREVRPRKHVPIRLDSRQWVQREFAARRALASVAR